MKDPVQVEEKTFTNEVFREMHAQYKNRVKAKIQRQFDFFHKFENEVVNSEVTLNGRYNVDVIFTPEDNWFIIEAINVNDGALSYPCDFRDTAWSKNNVYDKAINYLSDHPELYRIY